MPTIRDRRSLAANATNINPLQGTQYEFLPFNARVEVAVVADAAGVNATVFSGSDILQQQGSVTIKAANAAPVYPDDFHLEDAALAGERIAVILNNTTAGAINVETIVKLSPV